MDKESESKYELIDATLSLIQLAHSKGFDSSINVKSFMLEPWMSIQEIFANTACVALQWWLRRYHSIDVWVEPSIQGKYCGYFLFGNEWQDTSLINDLTIEDQYELHFIKAIEYALNALPPAAQEHH